MMSSTNETGIKTLFHVTIHVRQEDAGEFLATLRTIHDDVTAEKECLFVDTHQSPQDAGLFRITEVWAGDIEWCKSVRDSTFTA
jgi:quinol monooxygenase YgiN